MSAARGFIDTIGRRWAIDQIAGMGYLCEAADCGQEATLMMSYRGGRLAVCFLHPNIVTVKWEPVPDAGTSGTSGIGHATNAEAEAAPYR